MLVEKILEMKNEEIIKMLNEDEKEYAIERFSNLNNFCDIYQDGARLSNEDEFISPSEYLDMLY